MNIKHIIKKGGLAIVIMSMSIPFLVGCRDKTPKVKDLHYVNLQITKFSISKNNTDLNNIQFAINQNYTDRKADGYIYNIQKLEYGVVLDSIKIDMDYSTNSVASLEYSIGSNNVFKTFNPKTDSVFVGSNRILKIRMLSVNSSDAPRTYIVNLNQYSYKSGTIDYKSPIVLSGYPLFSWSKSLNNNGNNVDIFTQNKGNSPIVYIVNENGSFSKKNIDGIPSDEMLSNVIYVDDNTAYAMTDNGLLYKQVQRYGAFTPIKDIKVEALLGYIRVNSSINLAVITNDSNGVSHFSIYNGSSISMGQVVPDGFPVSGFYSINSSEQWVGDNIHLVAGIDNNGKMSTNVWYTTNGTDWIVIEQTGLPDNIKKSAIAKYNDGMYQLVVTADNNVKLFVSKDNGASWIEDSEGLPIKDFDSNTFSQKPFTIFSLNKMFYIIRATDSNSSTVYKGELRRLTE